MRGLVRITGLLVVGCMALGCSLVPARPSVEPTVEGSPTQSSTSPTSLTFPPPLIGLPIDARRVISTPGIGCTGGPLGGEASEATSYDVWTLHCPAGAGAGDGPAKLVDALKAEALRLGAVLEDEGAIDSSNAGNNGDEQVTLHYAFENVDIRIRVTSLNDGDGSLLVVTIDQRRL